MRAPRTYGELAAATAAEIRRRGWFQGMFYDDGLDEWEASGADIREMPAVDWANCPVCVWGAVNAALGFTISSYSTNDLAYEFMEVLGRYTPSVDEQEYGSLPAWNDRTGQSERKVLAALDAASVDVNPLPDDIIEASKIARVMAA